jgi:hypothetical protein
MPHICYLRYSGGRDKRMENSRPAEAKVAVRPCLENKGDGSVAQVFEQFPSIYKFLGSIPTTGGKKILIKNQMCK